MAVEIKESDWKLFRQLHKAALERFCERVLNEIRSAMVDDGESYHDRYLEVFALIRDRDKAIASMFDDVRRSNALILLATSNRRGCSLLPKWPSSALRRARQSTESKPPDAHNKSLDASGQGISDCGFRIAN